MFKFVLPAVAALGCIAFAAHSAVSETPSVDLASPYAGKVAPVAMAWHLSHEGAMAKLAYGVENSDQLALMMTCEPGQSSAVVYGDVQPASPRLTPVAMGPNEIDPMTGGDAVETRISLRDPALRDLAGKGFLRVEGEAGPSSLPATEDEQRLIAGFLAYCGTAQV